MAYGADSVRFIRIRRWDKEKQPNTELHCYDAEYLTIRSFVHHDISERQSIFKTDGKLVQNQRPVEHRHRPLAGNLPRDQVQEPAEIAVFVLDSVGMSAQAITTGWRCRGDMASSG